MPEARPPAGRSLKSGADGAPASSLWPAVVTAVVAALVGAALQKHLAPLSSTAPSPPQLKSLPPPPSSQAGDTTTSKAEIPTRRTDPPTWSKSTFAELPAVGQPVQLARDLGYMDAEQAAEMESRVHVRKEMVSVGVHVSMAWAHVDQDRRASDGFVLLPWPLANHGHLPNRGPLLSELAADLASKAFRAAFSALCSRDLLLGSRPPWPPRV